VELSAPEMVKGTSPAAFRRRLEGHLINRTARHGKHLLVEIEGSGWLDLHFGMSGFPEFVPGSSPLPRYTRMALDLDRGRLAYVVPRRLGRLALVDNPEELIAERNLGPDLLDPKLDFAHFVQLSRGRGSVKCWLMDQSLMAGIGNVYSDEVLYQSRIHPKRAVKDLSRKELRHLYTTLHRVVKTAIEHDADPKRLPSTWLLTHRRAGRHCPACDGKIARLPLCGRSSYFCPACQH
jgi:formamidopyrimidine-DNA glycosylase